MFKIDHFAYSNNLRAVHPLEKFLFAIITMLLCLIFGDIITSLAVLALMSGCVIMLAGINWRLYVKLLTLPLSFLLVGIVAIIVSLSLQPVDFLYGFNIGRLYIGIQSGDPYVAGRLFFKALGAVSCLYFLALTTPMTEIFTVLRKFKVPPLFIELMELIYRFIFVLLETAGKIHLSQNSRWGYASFKSSYRSLGILLSNLFARAYWRSKISFTALLSRGYTGNINVLQPEYNTSMKNICLIAVVDILLLLLGLYGRGII
ncbi:MAG: cobalt/nickel transport system permease protein [Clostridia bacterium]|nr:cobalt transporter, inner rane subunit CbiQ [Clostridiales bacterium]MDK2986824.1 cobalt/nickel transport system permease protein [Clostridia bacterium]